MGVKSIMNIREKFKGKKNIILGVLLSLIVVLGVGYKIIEPPAREKVLEKIKDYDANEAAEYLDKVYPNDGGFLGMFKEKNSEYKRDVLFLLVDNMTRKLESSLGRSIEDYKAVKISKVDIEKPDYDSDYLDINVTVENGGETPVNYIKINLFFMDESDNIIKSDWTNDNAIIKPGASQVISAMTENDGWHSVQAEIAEIK